VTIVIPTGVAMSPTSLPDGSVFPASPMNATFALSGGHTYTGNITTTSPTYSVPAPSCPPPCYVYTYTYPAPCLVYVIPTSPACLWSRPFVRRSYCCFCW
jgi:hypothetical protein